MEKLLKTQQDKDEFLKWMEALESGTYQQSGGMLQNSEGYCCLGVACKVLIPEEKLLLNGHGYISGINPHTQEHAPFWLKHININYQNFSDKNICVWELNDAMKLSFEDIAKVLRKAYRFELDAISHCSSHGG
jgi:hypothetical protein